MLKAYPLFNLKLVPFCNYKFGGIILLGITIKTKMLLLSIFLFLEAISVFSNTKTSGAVGTNYQKGIVIPLYDPKNPEHFLITPSNNGWNQINNPKYKYFFVDPGNYSSVSLTQSGTVEQPRYICLHNDDSVAHPAQLASSLQANVPIQFIGVQNWVIDRISVLNYNVTADRVSFIIRPVSKNIIINRCYFYNFCRAIEIQSDTSSINYTSDITIQNCRLERMSANGLSGDNVAIFLLGKYTTKYTKIENVHILNNEIINCNDGIQTLRYAGTQFCDVDYAGLIIDSNHIYVDTAVYTDGNGHHDPNGINAWTENAIDLKAGSDNPDNPVIVSNNFLWGFRHTDTNGGGSGDMGYAMVGHYDAKNIIIKNNVIFNSTYGIGFRDNSGSVYSGENIVIANNILADISKHSTIGEALTLMQGAINSLVEKNTFVADSVPAIWFETYQNPTDPISVTITKNVLVNMKSEVGDVSTQVNMNSNYFYHTPTQESSHGTSFPNVSDAGMTDLTFTTDRFTTHLRTITLKGVVYPIDPPTALIATPISKTQVNISWTAPSCILGVSGYEIYRDGIFISSDTAKSYSDVSLTANTTYVYSVRSLGYLNNRSGFSDTVQAKTLETPLSLFPVQKGLNNIKVFPVPFVGGQDHELTFCNLHGQSSIQILSMDGKQLISVQINQPSYSLNPDNLSSGVYIYTVKNDHCIQTGKLILKMQ